MSKLFEEINMVDFAKGDLQFRAGEYAVWFVVQIYDKDCKCYFKILVYFSENENLRLMSISSRGNESASVSASKSKFSSSRKVSEVTKRNNFL
jgi:hypothetical protein